MSPAWAGWLIIGLVGVALALLAALPDRTHDEPDDERPD